VLSCGQARPGKTVSAVKETVAILREAMSRQGDRGGLRMSVERATLLMHAAGVGFVLTQIGIPTADRDPQLSVIARENALSAIMADNAATPKTQPELPGRAVALREALLSSQASR
jgi:hypothetical protein